jgi:hypothetical protein
MYICIYMDVYVYVRMYYKPGTKMTQNVDFVSFTGPNLTPHNAAVSGF